MIKEQETSPQEDEPILCVHHRALICWIGGLLFILLGCLALYSPSVLIPRGDYVKGIVGPLGGLGLLLFGLEVFLRKQIVFYHDRIVQVWHFLGKRTIPYKRARLIVPPVAYLVWTKVYRFKEADDNGYVPILQVPIAYSAMFASRETRKKVDKIVSFLVGVKDDRSINEKSRLLQEHILPKELL